MVRHLSTVERAGVGAFLALLLNLPVGASSFAQSTEPVFHLPFACGETWTASTRFDVHRAATEDEPAEDHPAHSPSPNAVDFNRADDLGDAVYAGADGGTVVKVYSTAHDAPENDENQGYGNMVDISYPGGITLRFAHLDTVAVTEEAPAGSIMADTRIGTVGATGLGMKTDPKTGERVPSTAYHLHYEQRDANGVRLPVIEDVRWAVGTQIADDHDDLRNHPGIANVSANCGEGTAPPPEDDCGGPAPVTGRPPVLGGLWIAPVGCATVTSPVTLTAWPTRTLPDVTITELVFHARWADGDVEACRATEPDVDGTWSCDADLAVLGIPPGAVELSFDVFDDVGDVTRDAATLRVTHQGAAGGPTVAFAKGTTRNKAHVAFGDAVKLVATVEDSVDLDEVRFLAYYPDWPDAADAAKVPRFDPRRAWRVLAVCRPPGDPSTKGCRWDGDRRSATVSWTWDPSKGERKRSVEGVPRARAAITGGSRACVPVTLGIVATDTAGATAEKQGGMAGRCDATAPGVGRTVYLDPLRPPPAPKGVSVQRRGEPDCSGRECEYRWRLRWADVEGETSFRIEVANIAWHMNPNLDCTDPGWFVARTTPRRLLKNLPADSTSYDGRFTPEGDMTRRDPRIVGNIYYIIAVNAAGDSPASSTGKVYWEGDGPSCEGPTDPGGSGSVVVRKGGRTYRWRGADCQFTDNGLRLTVTAGDFTRASLGTNGVVIGIGGFATLRDGGEGLAVGAWARGSRQDKDPFGWARVNPDGRSGVFKIYEKFSGVPPDFTGSFRCG